MLRDRIHSVQGFPILWWQPTEGPPIRQGEPKMIESFFDPKDLTLFAAVLDQACSDEGVLDESRRRAMAFRIMRLAKTGERDSDTLKKCATA